jgi:hypothetical protein
MFHPPTEWITNADMDGIAVALASESGPTAHTYFLDHNHTSDVRCYGQPLFA